jgi:hypothetical protein
MCMFGNTAMKPLCTIIYAKKKKHTYQISWGFSLYKISHSLTIHFGKCKFTNFTLFFFINFITYI